MAIANEGVRLLTAGPGRRWIFFINVPPGLLLLLVLPRVIRAADGGARLARWCPCRWRRRCTWSSSPSSGTGLAFLPIALGTIVGAHAGGHAVAKVDGRVLTAGALAVAAFTTALTAVEPHEAGSRSGIVNTFHELGGALGVAVLSSIAASGLTGAAGRPASAMRSPSVPSRPRPPPCPPCSRYPAGSPPPARPRTRTDGRTAVRMASPAAPTMLRSFGTVLVGPREPSWRTYAKIGRCRHHPVGLGGTKMTRKAISLRRHCPDQVMGIANGETHRRPLRSPFPVNLSRSSCRPTVRFPPGVAAREGRTSRLGGRTAPTGCVTHRRKRSERAGAVRRPDPSIAPLSFRKRT